MATKFSERGMNNYYNAISFSTSVETFRVNALEDWQDLYGINDYYKFSTPMSFMVEEYLMGGINMTKTASAFLDGFNSSAAR